MKMDKKKEFIRERGIGWMHVTIGVLFFILVFCFPVPPASEAAIYVMMDANGVYHFTNVPTSSGYHLYTPGYTSRSRREKKDLLGVSRRRKARYEALIRRYARKYGVEPALIKAIIHAESQFNPYAISKKGARGLMQLMPETARDLAVRNVFDPEENIRAGVVYFKRLLSKFKGDLRLSLAAYNAGPHLVASRGKVPSFRETRNYVKKVLTYYRQYR